MRRSIWPRRATARGVCVEPTPHTLHTLLRRLHSHHTMLRLETGGEGRAWQTMLLDVAPERAEVVVDDPFPAGCPLQEGAALALVAAIGGDRRIRLPARLISRAESGWRLALPDRQIDFQRRYAHRVSSAAIHGSELWCAEFREGDRWYAAAIDDVSLTGIRLRMSGPFLPSLRKGGRLRELCFNLGGHRFVRQGSVCRSRLDEQGVLAFGCALDVAPAADDSLLDRLIRRHLQDAGEQSPLF